MKAGHPRTTRRLMALAAALAVSAPVQAAETQVVTTPRRATISVVADAPPGLGPFPAVVLAPGTGAMRQPINDAVADALVRRGFIVFRFDWAYYVKDKASQPSDTDRAPEIEDFATVVGLAKVDNRVDPTRIIVGGKSRGTIIAWRVLRADPSLAGLLQLTPVCTKAGFTPAQLYPEIASEARPSLWIFGDTDPACQARTFYGFLAGAGAKARGAALRGDHGLAEPATRKLAADLAADFAHERDFPLADWVDERPLRAARELLNAGAV